MIVVLATDHPERDEWVDRQAQAEAAGRGETPGPYQGVHQFSPNLAPVHVFADAARARCVPAPPSEGDVMTDDRWFEVQVDEVGGGLPRMRRTTGGPAEQTAAWLRELADELDPPYLAAGRVHGSAPADLADHLHQETN